MWVQRMHIQVMAPKVETKLTNQPKTVEQGECLSINRGRSRWRTSLAAGGEVKVDEEAESGAKDEGRVGDAQAVYSLKDGWSFSFNGKTVESTGADVEVGICGAQHEDEDGTVDNVVEDFNTDQGGGNNEGGGGGSNFLAIGDKKGGVCSRDNEANNENAADIEDQDAPKGPLDGDWDVLPRILGFTDGDAN